ncbi:DUF1896 family protein [Dysgonomonas sp. Marseille-P4677]|uniref:DUF1896 family protein n=1 Tax=Dysgonomonas sp. Marseille-P4677 TaxID=2364790 RepID=UPI0019124549|nr:DUF1896 family protein [Dysgonomonas sp. Marseille-P4677]MBK5720189.1 DUF1896 family protein [Dysgonomonas sp. Marseille-P4677]
MKSKNKIEELSYYGLLLHSFLKESHPQIAYDYKFIKVRADIASEIYSKSKKDGYSHDRAEEIATKSLYTGLLFSKFDTIRNILWEEFSYIHENEVDQKTLLLLPFCEEVFAEYTLHDEFANSPEYNQLYTELTGQIDIWEEQNEL